MKTSYRSSTTIGVMLFGSIFTSLVSVSLSAAPSVTKVSGSPVALGGTVVLEGAGFGSRGANVAPVLMDFGSESYDSAKLNLHQSSFSDGQPILRSSEGDVSSLWDKPSVGDSSGVPHAPVISLSRTARSEDDKGHYFFEGANSFLGWPTAYGGSDTPTDNSRLYVAWHLKMKYDPRFYWAISAQGKKGEFISGEKVSVGDIKGTYIGKGTVGNGKGMHHFVFDGQKNANALTGNVIRGNSSSAQMIFPENFAGGSGNGYESPGANKYLRVWEDPQGKDGVRISWTQIQVHKNWVSAPITPDKWHLMEFFLDTDENDLSIYVDRKLLTNISTSDTPALKGALSPTIALIGFNGKLQEFQETDIDDIYMDYRFSRVVLGAKSSFSELESYELQIPVSWSNNKIEFIPNLGALNPKGEIFAYVISGDGQVNEKGFPLCASCNSPPSAIQLKIE